MSSIGIPAAFPTSVKRRFSLAMLLIAGMMPLQCATLERLSLDDLIVKSTSIVRGTVVESHAVASRTDVFTHYTVQVAEILKGAAGAQVDVVVPGGVAGNVRQSIPGAPSLSAGSAYVLFLWTGASGVTQVIGFTQGLFALAADPGRQP